MQAPRETRMGGQASAIEDFDLRPDGQRVSRVAICGHGLSAWVLTHGATLQDLRLAGFPQPLVLGFPRLEPYLTEGMYFGAVVGRFANRIGHGRAWVGGEERQLNRNFLDRHLLHGGADGTGVRNWRLGEVTADRVTLHDHLPDGHMGFPGAMDVTVRYAITAGPVLEIEITAATDAETLCNFAQHSFFNLSGQPTIADHRLRCPAERYTATDPDLIPTGETPAVKGTRHDWRQPMRLGDRLDAGLIDDNLCLGDRRLASPRPVAWLSAPGGPALQLESTEPGLQVYAGDHIHPGAPGLEGQPYRRFAGLALEPQLWPDAPNHPGFPSALLRPGETYRQITRIRLTPAEASPEGPKGHERGGESPLRRTR
ncbi:aldose 1-epimerase [Paracoccus chinensis]|uniref:Aldose 1-epimerase n=2 Tax=Paracoccus chinensis TaxID=525640 RepID=A0A1G9JVN5_9RHOB|nr:aldose 1-epimerase [Paracoccus chinensis]